MDVITFTLSLLSGIVISFINKIQINQKKLNQK
jgi:hypothetical protein